jgi:hypothetical protein
MSSQSDRATSAVRWRRWALGSLAALAAAAAIIVPSVLASGKTSPPVKPPPTGSTSPNDCGGPAPTAAIAAIAQLEQNGTIDHAQAQAIDAGLNGCFDLEQLVNNGTITAAQARAVENALRQVKLSLANAQGAPHK